MIRDLMEQADRGSDCIAFSLSLSEEVRSMGREEAEEGILPSLCRDGS